MRNRAKCRLCQSIIESFHRHDYVTCTCGEIAVDGGRDYLKALAKDFTNFLRIDDEDKVIPVKVIETLDDVKPLDIPIPPTKEELISMLEEMAKSYENLPQHAMLNPVTNYDLASSLLLISQVFKALLR